MANDEEELAKIIAEPGAVPGSLRHELPQNGGQSQSAAEPEKAATQLPEAELSESAPPEAMCPMSARKWKYRSSVAAKIRSYNPLRTSPCSG